MVDEGASAGESRAVQATAEVAASVETGAVVAEPEGRAVSDAEPTKKDARPSAIEALKPGMRFKGRVRSIVVFGAFVDIGVGRDGLLHISILKRAGIDKSIQVGDTVDVSIRRVDLADNRVSLTMPGGDREQQNKTPLRDLRVGSVVTGRVVRLADFGAFVDIGGQVDGLLHVSQLPWGYVNTPAEVLHVGDEVQVRIQEVDARKRRISLSMRELDQPAAEEPEPAKAAEPSERLPTAFEAAFEKAQSRRQRRAPA